MHAFPLLDFLDGGSIKKLKGVVNMSNTDFFSTEQKLSARAYIESLDDNTVAYIVQTILSEHSDRVIYLTMLASREAEAQRDYAEKVLFKAREIAVKKKNKGKGVEL